MENIEQVELDGKTYKIADMSPQAKRLIEEIKACDENLNTYQIEILKQNGTRVALIQALKSILEQSVPKQAEDDGA